MGPEELQYINIAIIPGSDSKVKPFTIRVPTPSLKDLQPRLLRPIVIPNHLTLQASLIDKFVIEFKKHVDENPLYYVDEVRFFFSFNFN